MLKCSLRLACIFYGCIYQVVKLVRSIDIIKFHIQEVCSMVEIFGFCFLILEWFRMSLPVLSIVFVYCVGVP